MHTHMHTHAHTHKHVHTHMRAYTRTYKHTHTHTYTHTRLNMVWSASKDLLSVKYYWNKTKMTCCKVIKGVKMNTRTNKSNSDSSEQKYVYLSNGLIQSFEICYMFTVWIHTGHRGYFLWECHTCPLFSGGL